MYVFTGAHTHMHDTCMTIQRTFQFSLSTMGSGDQTADCQQVAVSDEPSHQPTTWILSLLKIFFKTYLSSIYVYLCVRL